MAGEGGEFGGAEVAVAAEEQRRGIFFIFLASGGKTGGGGAGAPSPISLLSNTKGVHSWEFVLIELEYFFSPNPLISSRIKNYRDSLLALRKLVWVATQIRLKFRPRKFRIYLDQI